MIRIFRRELLEQLQSFKFAAGLLIVFLLFGVNGAIFSLRYQNEVTEYRQFMRRWERKLAERKTLDDLPNQDFDVVKVPLSVAFLASGGQDRLPNDFRFVIRIWGPMIATRRVFSQNVFIESFQALDWSFLVGTAFSLLALVFVYDTISGEKARGTVKLIQTYSVSRNAILFGKLLANLVTLLAMLVMGMLVSLLILLLVGQIALGLKALAQIALFLILAVCYITLPVPRSLSCLARTPAGFLDGSGGICLGAFDYRDSRRRDARHSEGPEDPHPKRCRAEVGEGLGLDQPGIPRQLVQLAGARGRKGR